MRFVHPALQNLVMVFQYSGTLDRKVLVELVLGYNKESGRWGWKSSWSQLGYIPAFWYITKEFS